MRIPATKPTACQLAGRFLCAPGRTHVPGGGSPLHTRQRHAGHAAENELEMYMAGNVFGPLVPVTEMPGLPFTFKNSAEVFAALDGELGDYIRGPAREGHLRFPARV
jgi:hypothetical protein